MDTNDKPSQRATVDWLDACTTATLAYVQTGEYPTDQKHKTEPPKRSARILRNKKGGVSRVIMPMEFRDKQARYEARVLPSWRAYECIEDREWVHAKCAADEAQLALHAETARIIYQTVMQHMRFRMAALSAEQRKAVQRRVKAVIRRELLKRISSSR